ncbi:MAG TPA: SusE domain-containing protein [Bacteroidales bacterium]|nr:SusE domain-containing protein [Bacteroidales bacterium]
MKKISILLLTIGLFSLVSCKKDETKTVLEFFKPAVILTPSAGSAFVLKEELKDSLLFKFTWSAAEYNLKQELIPPTYTLEMDLKGNNFSNPKVMYTGQGFAYSMTVGAMNDLILSVFNGVGDSLYQFQYRVKASLASDNPATNNISDVVTFDITAYSAEVILPPIYLLGDATTVGWDNTKARVMSHLEGGKFAIVEHLLTGGKFIKFIANRGAWAPQWGTDAAATPEAGNLVYRPTESEPDPPAIPCPLTEGDFRIVADTALMTYTVTATSMQLFLVGDGCTAGWDPASGIAFTKDSTGYFSLTTTLAAGNLKFMETTTGWAPQWGTDESGSSNFGNLVYRPTESVPDPPSIPSPGAGSYKIFIDLVKLKYKIKAAN